MPPPPLPSNLVKEKENHLSPFNAIILLGNTKRWQYWKIIFAFSSLVKHSINVSGYTVNKDEMVF